MDILRIQGTNETPNVNFDSKEGLLSIKGISRPENVTGFYKEIIEWLEEYCKSPKEKTIFNIFLTSANSSTTKILLIVLNILKNIDLSSHKVIINWGYNKEDETMLENGTILRELTGLVFKFEEIQEPIC